MGASQRRKGQVGERELAAILSEHLGIQIKRKLGQEREGGDDVQVQRFRIDAKRQNALRVMDWCRQAEAACTEPRDIPVVAFRQDGEEWRVVLRLEDFIPMLRDQLE